jgi:two-component system, NtrC family, nitrogen regulation sensor histidine kinase NtrY
VIYEFRFNIILRVVIHLAIVAGLALSFEKGFYLTTAFLAVLLAVAVINMIRYVNQTNRDLANFFEAIQYNDFTATSSARHKGESFGQLYERFNFINRKFQEIRAEKEANHQFLQTIVEHIDIGLLGLNSQGEIILMNKALQALLHKSYLINFDSLQQIDEQLWKTVKELKGGERELVKVNINNKLLQLAVQSIDLTLNKQNFRLISFQNIRTELEEQELVAWQKLIRILTHEIMNSVAPIASLSSTICDVLRNNGTPDDGTIEQIKNSVGVIQKRSEGLLNFTETYRSLTRIPPPQFQTIDGRGLIDEVHTLFKTQLEERNIVFEIQQTPPGSFPLLADPNLLEQVLINLVKNAMDAVEGRPDPKIEIYLQRLPSNKTAIRIADNGPGIPQDMLEQVFVPFFTTKKEGSGIGLSLSRQIMRLHKGNIEIYSAENEGTVVSLTF